MLTAGIKALADLAPAIQDPNESLLPYLKDLRAVSVKVAVAVANAAKAEGRSRARKPEEPEWTEDEMREKLWDPVYRPLELVEK